MPSSKPSAPRPRLAAASLAVVALAAACGDPSGPGACTARIVQGRQLVLLAGTRGQATATVTCERDVAPAVRWTIGDSTRATVDPGTGRVTALAPGQTTLTATVAGQPSSAFVADLLVVAPLELVVTPRTLGLLPGTRTQLSVATVPTNDTPDGYPRAVTYASSDSCIVAVGPDGMLRAGREGGATITVALAAAPGVRERAEVAVRVPAAQRFTVQAVTDAATGAPLDPGAPLRGVIAVRVNVAAELVPPAGGRLDVTLGGQPVGTVLLAAGAVTEGALAVPVRVDLDARDAAGARRFPAGAQALDVALVVPDLAGNPGCAPINLGQRLSLPLRIAGG